MKVQSKYLQLNLAVSLLAFSCCQAALADFDPTEIERVYKAKNYAEVENIAKVRLAIDAYDVRARYFLAGALLNQKHPQQAMAQYEACIKLGGETDLAKMSQQALNAIRKNPKAFEAPEKKVVVVPVKPVATEDPAILERKAIVQKELDQALNVHRRAKVEQLNRIASDEQDAIDAASRPSPQRDALIKAANDEAEEKRATLDKVYTEIEKRTTAAFQERIDALTKRK